jgi:hypothetical protein
MSGATHVIASAAGKVDEEAIRDADAVVRDL